MTARVIRADARALPLAAHTADLIVTSPPYWNQRDYRDGGGSLAGQIGAEETPAQWLASMVDATREWCRVLKPCGSLWVVLGDKYATRWPSRSEGTEGLHHSRARDSRGGRNRSGVPEKSLIGLPWRYALACVDDLGLHLRAEVIWSKPNGLPESVLDRVGRRHETVFHFTRRARYYSAADDIREPALGGSGGRGRCGQAATRGSELATGHGHSQLATTAGNPLGRIPGSVWSVTPVASAPPPPGLDVEHFAAFPPDLVWPMIAGWSPPAICTACGEGRRPVTAMTGDDGRHPAGGGTYRAMREPGAKDTNLADAALRGRVIAGYVCACTPSSSNFGKRGDWRDGRAASEAHRSDEWHTHGNAPRRSGRFAEDGDHRPPDVPLREYDFAAWQPAPTRPAVVVDPFGGTGTTALVADLLGRDAITFDLSGDYCARAAWRISDPAERARAQHKPRPPVQPDGQDALFTLDEFAGRG